MDRIQSLRSSPALAAKIRGANIWNSRGTVLPSSAPPNDPKYLALAKNSPPLKQLPEEKVEKAEKEKLNGKPPEPPKVHRPLQDSRILVISSLMDRQTASTLVEEFQPLPWDTNALWLNPDNANEIQPDKLVLLFGKRRTGKSFAARWMLHTGRFLFNSGMVLANTDFNQYWQKYFPSDFVQRFDPLILEVFLEQQKQEVESWQKAGKPRSHNPYKVIVLDDVVGQNFRYVDIINDFATRGRHYCISVFLMTQYPKMINKAVKTNCDFAFVFFQQTFTEKQAIAEEFFSTVPLDNGMELIERFTDIKEGEQNRQLLVLDQMKMSTNLFQKVFLCSPDDPGEFVVGSPKFWQKDSRYERLLRKGAFEPWEAYNLYLKSQGQLRGTDL